MRWASSHTFFATTRAFGPYSFDTRRPRSWLGRAFAHKACRDGLALQNLPTCAQLELPTPRAAPWSANQRWARRYHPRPRRADGSILESIPGSFLESAEATVADSILDRLVHNAHRFDLTGESMRKELRKQAGKEE